MKPSSAAIVETYLDFWDSAEYAKKCWSKINGFSQVEKCWEGTHLHFLTEQIHPKITLPERTRVMMLFSNPHPASVKRGLFMSEKSSRSFWQRLYRQLGINDNFRWDSDGINETVSLLLNGAYEGPLLFFECLYQIPSKSPKDLRKLFSPRTVDFERYLHCPSLRRIGTVLNSYRINTVLVFTRETFDSITRKPGISKGSREILRSSVENAAGTGNREDFWKCIAEHKLIQQIPNLKHNCMAIKVMDTRAKNWWKVKGQPVFWHVLEYALEYAKETRHQKEQM